VQGREDAGGGWSLGVGVVLVGEYLEGGVVQYCSCEGKVGEAKRGGGVSFNLAFFPWGRGE
jgi:hypothetical protein